jgi:PncC family amidohydrolase
VSEEVAEAMAQGALKALNCNWAVSITGIAGPEGGSEKKPVGTVCFFIIGLDYVRNVHILKRSERKLFKGNRHDIQTQAVDHALLMLENALLLSPSNSQA